MGQSVFTLVSGTDPKGFSCSLEVRGESWKAEGNEEEFGVWETLENSVKKIVVQSFGEREIASFFFLN